MARSSHNTQLFALPTCPPEHLTAAERHWRMEKVFKHDFFAATVLYAPGQTEEGQTADTDKLVVKFGRVNRFCGLGCRWIGRLLARRERRFHELADDVPGIQPFVEALDETSYALRFLPGRTLDTLASAPGEGGVFFDRLRAIVDQLHARGIAYCDMNKRSNIVVRPDDTPALIDFQIAIWIDPKWSAWKRTLLGPIVRYMQRMDLYHMYKHKRRLDEAHLTDQERALAERRGPLIRIHRALVTPLRTIRRRFLGHLHRKGRLVSPSKDREDHYLPEKDTWRQPGEKQA